jgi:probable rRNA maturation factor
VDKRRCAKDDDDSGFCHPRRTRRRPGAALAFASAAEPRMIRVDFCNQSDVEVDQRRLVAAVTSVLQESSLQRAQVSLAVVDNATIHQLNRRHLSHDYPTDVLSFVLQCADGRLEGEVVVSAEMAAATAPDYGWEAADELLLYVIHGALHLVGYDDRDDDSRREMRAAEARHLKLFGVTQPEPPGQAAPPEEETAAGKAEDAEDAS